MDISSLPEAEQQKLQQLQIRFQEHQAQQQQAQQQQQQQLQNREDHASQAYDPSQYHQYYDQSAQSYDYSHYQQYPQQNHPQNHQYAQHLDQHYVYYQSDYANTYQPQQHYAQPEPVQPQVLAGGLGSVQVQQQQNVYYPAQSAQASGGEPQNSAPAYPGLNAAAAAAVAALSQLSQLAGTMDAAEKALAGSGQYMGHGPMPLPASSSRYRGGGRRGGGSFRGGGRGRGGPPLRGRGHDRSRRGPLRIPSHGKSSTSHSERLAAKDAKLNDEEAGPSARAPETAAAAAVPLDISIAASSTAQAAAKRKPKQGAWCELCKVDCTSLEMLEQHKNGKRHNKNMLRIGELKNAIKPRPAVQNEQSLTVESKSEVSQQPETVPTCEENKLIEVLNVEAEAGDDRDQVEAKQQNHTGSQSEGPVEMSTTKPKVNKFDNRNGSKKRKMKVNRAGKRPRTFEPLRRPIEPPKPKVVIPLICNLCNVKCDTREVLDRHLSGKKHIAKFKRLGGHQALYGPTGHQVRYPPTPVVQTLLHPQDHQQHFYAPQSSYPQPGAYMPPQAPYQALPPAAPGIYPQHQRVPQTHGFVATPDSGTHNVVAMTPVAQQPQRGTAQPEFV